jgi:hypothetical protein
MDLKRNKFREMCEMSMKYIRDTYEVPAKPGMHIKYTYENYDREGVIIGSHNSYLRVCMMDNLEILLFHPTFCITYLDKEEMPK